MQAPVQRNTLYHLVRQHAAPCFAQAGDATGADLPLSVKDELDAFLKCGIVANDFFRLRCSAAATTS